nr:translocation/assembly module TamB domain-containing protein [Lysobacter telluris]
MPLTPEQRAQRHAARRALARRVAWRSGRAIAALVVVVAVVAWWLLTTIGGRDVLLRQIVARLPQGTSLTWQRAEGPVSGPMVLHGVRFSMPRQRNAACVADPTHRCDMGTLVFTARTVAIDPALRPLLGRRLRLDALAIADATLELPTTTQPFELPRWPGSLPQIAPPLALRADAIRIDRLRVTRDGAPLVDIASVRGGIDAARGRLHVEHLRVDSDRGRFTAHGDYAPADDYRSDLTVTAVLPAAGGTRPALALVARGDLSAMQVAIGGHAPAPVRATLALHGVQSPRWTLDAQSSAFDPGLLTDGVAKTPVAFALHADGTGGHARLHGHAARGAWSVVVQPSQVALVDQMLELQPLVIDTLDGRITVRGRADLHDPRTSSLRFAVNARGLTWRAPGAPAVRGDADLGLAGQLDAWAAIGHATLQRGAQSARVQFDARGDRQHALLRRMQAATPGGALDASGQLRWAPSLQWALEAQLAHFDPGYVVPGWDGALDGRIRSSGHRQADGDLVAQVQVPSIAGRLRGRALQGHGDVALAARQYRGAVSLAIGASRVDAHGTFGDRIDLDARFTPLQLADLLPQARGVLRGRLQLRGPRTAPDIAVDLDGSGLAWGGRRLDALSAHGRLPWHGGGGALTLDARGLAAGVDMDRLQVQARGAVEALQLQASAQGPLGTMTLVGQASRHGGGWRGTLAALRLAPAQGAPWRLQSPARFAQDGARWTLSRNCFVAVDAGTVCASADWPRRGIEVNARGLPLALARPWLSPRSDGLPWRLHGVLDVRAHVQPVQGRWRGEVHVTSAAGGLRNSERARRDLVAYDALVFDARFDPRQLDATLHAGLSGNGRIDAQVATGWDAYARLQGQLGFSTDALTWMELLSPDIVDPAGRLQGHVTLGGTRAQPVLGGQAQLSGFHTEVPALALTLRDGNLRLQAQADGRARIDGRLRSGDGVLTVDGTLGWRGTAGTPSAPLVLRVRGNNVLASDTPELRAVIDPDVVVRYAAGQPLSVTGRVGVPSADIDLARLDRGATTSPDVVVLDPATPDAKAATPLALDLTLVLGDDVHLRGFGLDGTLDGSLQVGAPAGAPLRATGRLQVGGRYLAYGQKLDITRGDLAWNNDPIGDPRLDIRAQREVGDVTAGIDVSGRASRPHAQVWTDPATDQSQALAYLALGRPLSTASNDEAQQLDAAGAALAAGGNLIASQLGAKLGLDAAGVSQSRTLGASVLGVGKYLSPRLYVGYGVSLLGTGQVLTLKYLLGHGFDIEIESSTVENRASANWRKEK